MRIDIKKKKKGFTLIELIVVIAILAILAAIAVPNFIGMTKRAETATEVAAASELANAFNIYNTMNPTAQLSTCNDSTVASLAAQSLKPTFDSTIATGSIASKVYARVTFSGGIAVVTSKGNIG